MTLQEKILTLNTLAGTIDACVEAIRITTNSNIGTSSRELHYAANDTALEAVRQSRQLIINI